MRWEDKGIFMSVQVRPILRISRVRLEGDVGSTWSKSNPGSRHTSPGRLASQSRGVPRMWQQVWRGGEAGRPATGGWSCGLCRQAQGNGCLRSSRRQKRASRDGGLASDFCRGRWRGGEQTAWPRPAGWAIRGESWQVLPFPSGSPAPFSRQMASRRAAEPDRAHTSTSIAFVLSIPFATHLIFSRR